MTLLCISNIYRSFNHFENVHVKIFEEETLKQTTGQFLFPTFNFLIKSQELEILVAGVSKFFIIGGTS
jgi:hypothetical protein